MRESKTNSNQIEFSLWARQVAPPPQKIVRDSIFRQHGWNDISDSPINVLIMHGGVKKLARLQLNQTEMDRCHKSLSKFQTSNRVSRISKRWKFNQFYFSFMLSWTNDTDAASRKISIQLHLHLELFSLSSRDGKTWNWSRISSSHCDTASKDKVDMILWRQFITIAVESKMISFFPSCVCKVFFHGIAQEEKVKTPCQQLALLTGSSLSYI